MKYSTKRQVLKKLKNKNIVVAVTGSVAAYKGIELVREFRNKEASVRVLLTPSATRFVTPLSFEIASNNEVLSDIFSPSLSHIELPRWGDVMVVAPITAHTVSKFAAGAAPDIVSASFLSFREPVIIAPAMNWRMYTNPIFQEKLHYLKEKGVVEVPPEEGPLACGEEGVGRMASIDGIVSETVRVLSRKDLVNKKIVVTAGPTRESMDPVRFISNRSSGKMGFSIARSAYTRGADVVLISGPSSITPPYGVTTEYVETAQQMKEAVMRNIQGADVLVMAAAVADYVPGKKETGKIEKGEGLTLDLVPSPDIIADAAKLHDRPFIVGFAAETGDKRDRAREKMRKKGMDMIVFNNVSLKGSGFDVDTNEVTLIDGVSQKSYPLMSKDDVSAVILDRVAERIS